MYLAYSALDPSTQAGQQNQISEQLLIRYQAYLAVCEKRKSEIAAIRKYLPDWKPNFNY